MKRFEDIREKQERLVEGEVHASDPPPLLTLRRKAIRLFGGGERVALYSNDKLGIEVSIPYKEGQKIHGVATAIKEEEQLDEGVFSKIMHIAKSKTAGDVRFKNGATARVDPDNAAKIVAVHAIMNKGHKKHMEDVMNKGMAGVTKIANFAITHHRHKEHHIPKDKKVK